MKRLEETFFLEILKQAPVGFAYHKVILDKIGKPEDYIFIDINLTFEKMTELNRKDFIGKKVTEVLQTIKNEKFGWTEFYKKILSKAKKNELTQYTELLNSKYRARGFISQKGYLVITFTEITKEEIRLRTLEKGKKNSTTDELEMMYDSSQDPLFLTEIKEDGKFYYLNSNKACGKIIDSAKENIKGKTPIEIFGENMGIIVERNYKKCLEKKEKIMYKETFELSSGKRTWLTSLTPILEGEKVKFIIGSKKDITLPQKEQRENILRKFQTMINEHTAVMLLIQPITGKIIDANPAACNFYGYTHKELLNMYIQDINMLSDEDVKKRRLMTLNNKHKHFVFPHRLKNGEKKLVDVYSSVITIDGEDVLFSIIFDSTYREEYKVRLYEEKELLTTTLFSIGDGVITTDRKGNIKLINKVAQNITGWNEKEIIGKHFSKIFKLVNETTGQEIENPVEKVLKTKKTINETNDIALITKNGKKVSISDSASPIKDEKGEIFGIVMVFRDVSKEKAQQEKILYLSYHDSLTGLYNRRFMEEKMKKLDNPSCLPLAIIMGDLNGLKLTNDVFGHEAGDKLLIKAAKVIEENCRSRDIFARWGGDEFIIVLPKTDGKTVKKVVERIKKSCTKNSEESYELSISLGWAVKTKMSESLQQILQDADELMYQMKLEEGKICRENIINQVRKILREKSQETKEHTEKLKKYCLEIGKILKLSSEKLEKLSLLAEVHDIGKVAVDVNILKKPGPLIEEEWEEVRKHPEIGFRIARNLSELSSVAEYILCHHERWDGKGYPRGLKGKETPLLSRILAVADAFDVMTTDRVYHKKMSNQDAISEIKRNAGTQFDPFVSEKFIQISEALDINAFRK